MAAASEPLKRPGFGLPLKEISDGWNGIRFPTLLQEEWSAATLTIREVFMLWVVEQVTNKPSWNTKVFDDEILAKWKSELDQAPWEEATGFAAGGPCSEEMWDHIVKELQSKAKLYEDTGLIPIFEVSAAVIKSDSLITEDLKQDLRRAVSPLEDVPDEDKDWHPRSDGKVLDLVHPSLYPLVYGRSRIVSDQAIPLDSCLERFGLGEIIPQPAEPPSARSEYRRRATLGASLWSSRFQWLPCEVDINGESPQIVSYINNLHPKRHRELYGVIEKFIGKSLPLWDFIYRWPQERRSRLRISCKSVMKTCQVPEICDESDNGCDPMSRPLDDGEERVDEDDYYDLEDDDPLRAKDNEWFHRTHPCDRPEPTNFSELPEITSGDFRKEDLFAINSLRAREQSMRAGGLFAAALRGASEKNTEAVPGPPPRSRVQVIVKLANIHLTPEKPTYDGGAWHIEGQLNEHICATALYYYDNENITPSYLGFRTVANEEDLMMNLGYEQSDMTSINGTFAIDGDGNTLQHIGRAATPEGRLLAFPNVYQHRVAPFELADKTRPGHRKILALFLVDPHIPIISTANVPPQQEEWWLGEDGIGPREGESARLPSELVEMVRKNMDWTMSLKEAKETRLELMDERTRMDATVDSVVSQAEWNFCEH